MKKLISFNKSGMRFVFLAECHSQLWQRKIRELAGILLFLSENLSLSFTNNRAAILLLGKRCTSCRSADASTRKERHRRLQAHLRLLNKIPPLYRWHSAGLRFCGACCALTLQFLSTIYCTSLFFLETRFCQHTIGKCRSIALSQGPSGHSRSEWPLGPCYIWWRCKACGSVGDFEIKWNSGQQELKAIA